MAWLVRVGPAPVEAWACAMGWGRRSGFSHAERLERERWVVRCPMTLGRGSLLVATRAGVRMTGLDVAAARRPWFGSESTTQIRVLITQRLRGFWHDTEGVFDDRAGTFSRQRWGWPSTQAVSLAFAEV